tara:strand:+ start:139 stop:582 length:444 start_codon:yes stop_codon:yes gene_type:complete
MLTSVQALASQIVNTKVQHTGSSLPNDHPGNIEIQQGHPCKFPGRALEHISGFFKYKWDARHRDLKESAIRAWVEYHSLEEENVTLVRVFSSRMQKKLAVVSATEAPLFNGQKFPTMYCIVSIKSQLVKTYTKDELSEILGQGDQDI